MFGRISRLRKDSLKIQKDLENGRKQDPHYVGSTDFFRHASNLDMAYRHRGHSYWASMPEMLARAGHCYLLDKLKEMNIRDDYLCGLAESGEAIVNGEIVYAYPKGRERKLIYDAFEKFLPDMRRIIREAK